MDNKIINNIINYIKDKMNKTKDNWIIKFTYDEILSVINVIKSKNWSINKLIEYLIQEIDRCKNNFTRKSALQDIFNKCSAEMNK